MVDEEDQKKIGKYRNKKRVALNLVFYIFKVRHGL